ncbi:hypothetical protein AQ824_05980 [Burkholderia pseudomallei]|nr:hypothetical protein AQ744_08715 [Burkholderia pseudomallei]OMS58600.1 hypothetical protein AQ743_21995 [Burkholderia pseudomallei]OMS65263.1 hypothetical protein AQ745_21275 [Burkholderia pseudomallei]OMS81695.1 hypothetical protein AQ748_22895 [Burkholderia pseudomallei]OMS92251.1 hypothetical protein AQ747_21780 [Burkholderia pseudomallei]
MPCGASGVDASADVALSAAAATAAVAARKRRVFIESSTKVTESEARSAAASRAGEVAFWTGRPSGR